MNEYDVEISMLEFDKTIKVTAESLEDAEKLVMNMSVLEWLADVKVSSLYDSFSINKVTL